MPSAAMDTRIRGYDKNFVTPDLIGGLCPRLRWIPAFAGMTKTSSPPTGSGVYGFCLRHPRLDRGSMPSAAMTKPLAVAATEEAVVVKVAEPLVLTAM